MSTNKLMEAAADILSGSKSKATAMPAEKLPGADAVDLGGPTPFNGKPTDDSEKIHTEKGSKDTSGQNKSSISTKASAASAKVVDHLKKEETSTEDIDAIFEDNEYISEDFKQKAATIFEARLNDKVMQIQEEMESKYASMLEEAVTQIQEDLSQKIDDYLSYVVEQWMDENQLAIDNGLRTELSEEFISGLRNLFAEHYIDVPEDKVNLVDELSEKVVQLESKLDEEIERGIEYRKALIESRKTEITRDICEGLTATQAEKIKALAESVEFSTEDEYKEKLETIRENYFPSNVKKADVSQLHETVEDDVKAVAPADPFVAAVSKAISKTKPF
jgi:hypothetical protein